MYHSPTSASIGGPLTYTITVTNNGPTNVTGVPITSSFSAYLTNISCTKSGGAPCPLDGSGNIQDTVNLAVGASITYTVNATVIQSANGNIVSTASINVTDANPANNSTTDTTTLVIGSTPDGSIYNVMSGSYLTLQITIPTGPGWDVVYYERPNASGILLDWMIVEVSQDGSSWSPVFYWGDENPDTNTNVDFTKLPDYPQTPEEPDQRDIASAVLYNSTGIAIDLDSLGLSGTYYYIRFYAPPGDFDGHSEVDAVQVLH
jgi:uncharacterized repeat protein (TIGR01451 family)